MRTIKKVPISYTYLKTLPEPVDMEEGIIYISDQYKVGIHKCLCGCGTPTTTPFHKDGWKYSINNNKITLSPSIGNFQFPCKSHYIITKGVANFV